MRCQECDELREFGSPRAKCERCRDMEENYYDDYFNMKQNCDEDYYCED